jgi:hypothetical protein
MQRWKKWVASTAMTALLLGGSTSAVWAANTDAPANNQDQHQPVDHQQGHHGHHEGKHNKHPLTNQQKEAMKKAGVDPQAMRETQQQIHDVLKTIKHDGHALHEIVRNANDKKLRDQVDADLKAFRDSMGQARDLHHQNRALHDDFVTAVNASESAKIKELFNKMQANQKQELKYVQTAQKVMQDELKKIQQQVKS